MADVIVTADSLHAFYVSAFRAMNVPAEHSRICADGLHYADLHGIRTHGAGALNRLYLRMLRDGEVEAKAEPEIVRDNEATALVDGGNGLGFVGAEFGLREAVRRARRFGVGAVSVRNSSHCGCMGWYTGLASADGAIAIASTNLGVQGVMPPPGGLDRLLGTNVIAAGAPAGTMPPFSLDMSAAVVATGRIRLARDRGESVPDGWLADDGGRPVTDPQAYFDGGAQLQFLGGAPITGGYKGYGLAILADVLCGVLGGAGVGPAPSAGDGREDADIGHFFLAIDVSAFRDVDEFLPDMDRMLGALRGSRPARPDRPVSYPGLPEHEYRSGLDNRIPLPSAVVADLASVADELGLPPLVEAGRTVHNG